MDLLNDVLDPHVIPGYVAPADEHLISRLRDLPDVRQVGHDHLITRIPVVSQLPVGALSALGRRRGAERVKVDRAIAAESEQLKPCVPP